MVQTVQKTIEISQLQDIDEVDDVPAVLMVEQVPYVHVVAKTPEIPQLQITDKVIDVRAVSAIQAPRVRVVKKTVETPQLQIVKRTIEIPEIRMVRGTQTSESLGTARTGQLAQETKVYRDEACCMQQQMQQRMQQQEQQHQKPAAPDKAVMNVQRGDSRTFQIFVKTDDLKTMTMDVTPNDKIQDVVRRGMGHSEHDVYVTCEGRMLNENAELKSSEVRDGSTGGHEQDARRRNAQGEKKQNGKQTRQE